MFKSWIFFNLIMVIVCIIWLPASGVTSRILFITLFFFIFWGKNTCMNALCLQNNVIYKKGCSFSWNILFGAFSWLERCWFSMVNSEKCLTVCFVIFWCKWIIKNAIALDFFKNWDKWLQISISNYGCGQSFNVPVKQQTVVLRLLLFKGKNFEWVYVAWFHLPDRKRQRWQ